jgi:hypothetical protein
MNRIPMSRDARSAERFAGLLDIDGSQAATADPAMGSLLLVANSLRAAGRASGPVGPEADFRAALRQRLVAVATVQGVEPEAIGHGRTAIGSRAYRRIAAFAGTVAIVTSVAGVGVAASRSLPGDPFYGIKRGTESVQLWAASGNLAKGKRHLEFARTRLAEAQALPDDSSHLASTLTAMNVQTKEGTSELISAYQSSKSMAPLADLVVFSREQIAGLLALAPTLPVALRSQDTTSIQLLDGVVNQVNTVSNDACVLCVVPGGTPSPGGHLPSVAPLHSPIPSTKLTPQPVTSNHPSTGPIKTPIPVHTTLPTSVPTKLPTKLPTHLPTGILTIIPSLSPSLPSLGVHKSPPPIVPPLPIVSSLLPGL